MLDGIISGFWQAVMSYVVKGAMWVITIMWGVAISLSFCYTSNHFISNFEQASFVTRGTINLIRSFRHNCRIVWGVILPIDPKTYPGISQEEVDHLPQAEKALYQFPKYFAPLQRNGLKLIALQTLELEKTFLEIFMESKNIYSNTLLSSMRSEYNWDRTPSSEGTKKLP